MTEEELKILIDKREWILKANASLVDKSTSYTNVIMAAGYAAYFATWSNTRPLISDCLARISAALMLISLLTFVFWEVTKMVLIGINNKNISKIVLASLDEFDNLLQEHVTKEQKLMARFAIAWPVVLFIAIPTALVAIGIHIWALIQANFVL